MASRRLKKKQLKRLLKQGPKLPKILFLVWLTFVLDHAIFPGLKWINRKEGRFCVSCTHQRSKNWRRDRAAHCEGWSLIKEHWYGKEDRTHKACFRTTLNSKGKKENVQIQKSRQKIKGVDGDWMEYRFINKSYLLNEPNPLLQSFYLEGGSSSKNSLPPFEHLKNNQRNEPKPQNFDRKDPTIVQNDVQNSVSKPAKKRKYRTKRPKSIVQRPQSRENDSSIAPQNSPGNAQLTQSTFLARDETAMSDPQYWNQGTPEPQTTDELFKGDTQLMQNNSLATDAISVPDPYYLNLGTPEPQTTDVVFKGNEYQNVLSFKNQENYTFNSEYQPYTPTSSVGDIQEAFSPTSSHHVPSNYHSSLNCIYNPNESSFYPSTACTSYQNEYFPPAYHELQPTFDPKTFFDQSQSVRDTGTILRIPELSYEHLPDNQIEEALFKEAYALLETQEILSYLEF